MKQKVVFRSVTIRPLESTLGIAVLFGITLLFCPWLWKGLPDAYFPYSGVVAGKGTEFHLLNGWNHWDNYIIVEDAHGGRTKRYLGDSEYALVQTGTFVVKKRGFGELPLQPGQLTPSQLLQDLEERQRKSKP